MKLIMDSIALSELKKMSEAMFEGIVKAVVDIKKEIMMVDAPMHADQESKLLEMGSNQGDLWGIYLYPLEDEEHFVEFDSMIRKPKTQTTGCTSETIRAFSDT